jgi:hypothetical protein
VRKSAVETGERRSDGGDGPCAEKERRGEDGRGDHSLPWMRVLTTSRGKVATHPITPAIPPATSSAGHDKELCSRSATEVGFVDEVEEKHLQEASY